MSVSIDMLFVSLALAHLSVDMLNGSRSILLTYLGLSGATIGLISTAYVWMASLSQPFFGWLADRIGPRQLTVGGLLWMSGFYTAAMLLPQNWGLAALVAGSLGSGAFHPAGAMQATLQGRHRMAGKETTAASLFFMMGQAGISLAPILAGALLGYFQDVRGLLLLLGLAVPATFNLAWHMRHQTIIAQKRDSNGQLGHHDWPRWTFLLTLGLLAAMQSWAQQNMINFIPKHLSELGLAAGHYGLLTGLFMGGSALGNPIGGALADRFGKRRVAGIALLLASIPLYLIGQSGTSRWIYLLIPLAGALTGVIHSIVVVIAQRIIPGGMGLASGLILGFIFSAGALGMLFTGRLADSLGYPMIFSLSAGLVIGAALLTHLLPASVD